LAFVEKELQHEKMNNAALARYINAKRKKEENRMKEEARKKIKAPNASSLLLVIFE
jgi:hypothetical protein